jgi:hypothetical protein
VFVTEISTGKELPVQIGEVGDNDYKKITKTRYSFD